MGMIINAVNYRNGTYRTSSAERPEQKDGEAGKTRHGDGSAGLDQIDMGEDGIAVTEAGRQQGTEQTRTRTAAARRDTVEISEEGRAAGAKLQEQKLEAAAAEAEPYEMEDLSRYTDAELRELYYKGKITRQEYEEETGASD